MSTYKILFISDAWYPQTNGVVRTMDSLGKELVKLGHSVNYITPLDFLTIPCPTYPEIKLAINPWPKLYNKINKLNPQIVHISTEGPLGWFARRYCIKNKIKFTTSYHTKFPEYIYERIKLPIKFSYKFMRYFHKYSSNVLVTTESMKKELADNGFNIEKLKVWTRGVKHEVFSKGIKINHNLKPPVWIYVGRVAIEKNIKAFLDLDIDGSKIIVGGGPQLNELKKKYKNVLFTGMLKDNDIASYLASSDVFVFPSKTDTFGIVIIEALSAGLPIAGYPVPGPKDILDGTEINVLDWDLKSSALKALKINREKCKEISKKYTWEECAKIFLNNACLNY
jgi:glycosyltransferase involved in cell wall biosynthesis